MRHLHIAIVAALVLVAGAAQAAAQSLDPLTPAAAPARDTRFHPQFLGAPSTAGIGGKSFSPSFSDVTTARPKALVGLYASLAVVQVLDVTSTRAALRNGAVELNGTMRVSVGQQLGIKAAMTLGTIALSERLWKKSKIAAIATAVAANGALAMISANNLRNARAGR